MKNTQSKTRPDSNPYEIWRSFDGSWTWNVLKKWQADDNKPYARWFCRVVTPFTGPSGDLGDVYVSEIKSNANLVSVEGKPVSEKQAVQAEDSIMVNQ